MKLSKQEIWLIVWLSGLVLCLVLGLLGANEAAGIVLAAVLLIWLWKKPIRSLLQKEQKQTTANRTPPINDIQVCQMCRQRVEKKDMHNDRICKTCAKKAEETLALFNKQQTKELPPKPVTVKKPEEEDDLGKRVEFTFAFQRSGYRVPSREEIQPLVVVAEFLLKQGFVFCEATTGGGISEIMHTGDAPYNASYTEFEDFKENFADDFFAAEEAEAKSSGGWISSLNYGYVDVYLKREALIFRAVVQTGKVILQWFFLDEEDNASLINDVNEEMYRVFARDDDPQHKVSSDFEIPFAVRRRIENQIKERMSSSWEVPLLKTESGNITLCCRGADYSISWIVNVPRMYRNRGKAEIPDLKTITYNQLWKIIYQTIPGEDMMYMCGSDDGKCPLDPRVMDLFKKQKEFPQDKERKETHGLSVRIHRVRQCCFLEPFDENGSSLGAGYLLKTYREILTGATNFTLVHDSDLELDADENNYVHICYKAGDGKEITLFVNRGHPIPIEAHLDVTISDVSQEMLEEICSAFAQHYKIKFTHQLVTTEEAGDRMRHTLHLYEAPVQEKVESDYLTGQKSNLENTAEETASGEINPGPMNTSKLILKLREEGLNQNLLYIHNDNIRPLIKETRPPYSVILNRTVEGNYEVYCHNERGYLVREEGGLTEAKACVIALEAVRRASREMDW